MTDSYPENAIVNAKLAACMIILRYYIIPKTRLRAFASRLVGKKVATLQHMIANATIRWLSTRFPNSTHIIFYIHGGGFVSGSSASVTPYLLQLSVDLQARGLQADMFTAEYDLAPESPYPVALRQVVSAYRHIASQNKPIILAGDSAGGNLCLGLLRHLAKPHPSISPVQQNLQESGRIIAACLTSPWVNLKNNGDSYRLNANRDCLDKRALDRWGGAYLDGEPLDEYVNPIDCIDGWEEILPQHTLLISGDLDLFVADVQNLSENIVKLSLPFNCIPTKSLANFFIQSGYNNLEVYIAPMKGHVWNLVDFGQTQPGQPAAQGNEDEAHVYAGIHLQADWMVKRCPGRVM
ncbi:esterase [Fusarium beomiforme]|uniref:Esterase n=1 Tax=Fusarium beomiforme TaxID=44412 RepID=A0A9P5AMW0_9HYPO|nr:esterase [Fusarium beomiforme]